MAGEDDVRPDLVRDDVDVILFVQFHRLFQLPPLPDAAAGVVGAAQDGGMDVLFGQMLLHVGVVHPPDVGFVLHQRGVDDVITVVGQAVGEADVGGAVHQHLIAPGADAVQRADDAAQNAVLVADGLGGQAGDAVAHRLPADDGVIIFGRRVEVAEGRVLHPLDDGLLDGGQTDEVHVRHPHGDGVEPGPGRIGRKALAQSVYGDGIPAMTVGQGGEIIFHAALPPVDAKKASSEEKAIGAEDQPSSSSTVFILTAVLGLSFQSVGTDAILSTTSMPETTLPKAAY